MKLIGGRMEKIINDILKTDDYIEKTYKKGDEILTPIYKNNNFFIVISGSCTVMNQSISGDMLLIYKHERGSFFGESEMVSPEKAPLLVVANEDCRLAVFDRYWFIEKVKNNSEFALFIIKSLTNGMLTSTDRRTNLRFYTIKERYMYAVKKAYDDKTLGAVTKKELAEKIDAPMRSLNRVVMQCSEIIVYKNKEFIVTDEERLNSEVSKIIWGNDKY